ncbi:Flp pilus assembly protein CpaB [Ruminiclostridium cellobioparum]|uniref:Flp pilus assembly protein CpaB n=1 Tax=Ruminiclostridium cellobioparum TaxID=29355 RepID=UPI0028AB6416|nr:Flp pilus assembly protein CpaB [Ruminiclostridium cellobioparum]
MSFFRNRIFIAVVCLIAIICIVFIGIPKYVEKTKETIKVIRVSQDIQHDTLIEENMLTTVDIGKYNLPKQVITDKKAIVGKYSSVDLLKSDNLVPSKFKDSKAMQDQFLYDMSNRVAISVSVKSLAAGLSGKLLPGDVVSVFVYSKNDQTYNGEQGYMPTKGSVLDYPNLEYLEVGAVTNNKAQDTDQFRNNDDKASSSSSSTDTIIPTTITFLATKEQAKELVDAENSGSIHVVFRGRDQEAKKLLGDNKSQVSTPVKTDSKELTKAQNETSTGTKKETINHNSENSIPKEPKESKDTSQFDLK